jgi:hypothetical protein
VHCKSLAAQEVRAQLTARKLVQSKLFDVEMSLRGILRGFGLKVGPTTPKRFGRRIRELVKTRLKALERENRELRQANEILRKASAYFARAELDRRIGVFDDELGNAYRSDSLPNRDCPFCPPEPPSKRTAH